MKIRFAKGAFRIGRKPRAKQEPLTPGQADRVKAVVSSLTAPKPAPAVKAKPAAVHKAKPSTGRVLVGKELDKVIGQAIVEFCAAARQGAFLHGRAVRSLVR